MITIGSETLDNQFQPLLSPLRALLANLRVIFNNYLCFRENTKLVQSYSCQFYHSNCQQKIYKLYFLKSFFFLSAKNRHTGMTDLEQENTSILASLYHSPFSFRIYFYFYSQHTGMYTARHHSTPMHL